MEINTNRRTGDLIEIAGDYQFKALQSRNPMQRFWHQGKMDLIEQLLPPEKSDVCLDVGCGSGVIANYLAEYAMEVIAVDGSEDAIDFAQNEFKKDNLRFICQLIDSSYP